MSHKEKDSRVSGRDLTSLKVDGPEAERGGRKVLIVDGPSDFSICKILSLPIIHLCLNISLKLLLLVNLD